MSTSTDEISFPYPFEDDDDLVVISLADGVLTKDADYTVSGAGDDDGGSVTMVDGTVGDEITVLRITGRSQLLSLRVNGPYHIEDIQAALDKLTRIVQEVDEQVSRAIRLPRVEPVGYDAVLGDPEARKGMLVKFDPDTGAPTLHRSDDTSVDDAEAAASEAEAARDEAEAARDAAKTYRNEAEAARDEARAARDEILDLDLYQQPA